MCIRDRPLSLSSNNTVIISSTDGTDIRRDGQAELAGMKQDICYYRPRLICGKRVVVDST